MRKNFSTTIKMMSIFIYALGAHTVVAVPFYYNDNGHLLLSSVIPSPSFRSPPDVPFHAALAVWLRKFLLLLKEKQLFHF